jgi:diadenylate cyclase
MDVIADITNILRTITIPDIIDILCLTFIVYKLIKLIRETRAGQLIKGIMLIVIAYLVCNAFKLKTLSFLLEKAFNIGTIAILVMFQPELRRALEKVGRTSIPQINQLFGFEMSDSIRVQWIVAIDEICEACEELSATATGALIVMERQTRLGEQIDTGVIMNAAPTKELFGNIFYPKTPLHDGAVIMREGMILAAACFLPKPQKEELINIKFGSRHRAAIGMSENSDAVVIIVSEETGTISIAENGEITRNYNKESLKKILKEKFVPEIKTDDKSRRQSVRRSKSK